MEKIAYYLGQYHSIAENDAAWGEGFTEWHNVAKARPLYFGHRQPCLPGKLGFYNLLHDDALEAQLDYANECKVTAFCHWHYWFSGHRVLQKPFEKMIQLKHNNIKHMLGWANESWSGIWHGRPDKIILEQSYSKDECIDHARCLVGYFNSENYLRINNKPIFLIYKPRKIPNCSGYLQLLRDEVMNQSGLEIYLVGTWGPGSSERIEHPHDYGVDALVANNIARYNNNLKLQKLQTFKNFILSGFNIGPQRRNYEESISTLYSAFQSIHGTVHATVLTGWDNTPRSGRRGLVLDNFTQSSFKAAVNTAIRLEQRNSEKLLFIKSWNEWAEGNCLEPRFNEEWSVGSTFKAVIEEHDV